MIDRLLSTVGTAVKRESQATDLVTMSWSFAGNVSSIFASVSRRSDVAEANISLPTHSRAAGDRCISNTVSGQMATVVVTGTSTHALTTSHAFEQSFISGMSRISLECNIVRHKVDSNVRLSFKSSFLVSYAFRSDKSSFAS